ncbi:ATP-binding protein [Methanosarcina sp.]|uniref:ATP-binding protein n=1 Tax=Methanosarcina sp. TaxID=2213 RepID=UPI003BB7C7C5
MNLKVVENLPNASRFIDAMREIGYDVNQAVAELIDNSISAGSRVIKIKFCIKSERNFSFQISDDGKGMTKSELINAMRFGSEGDYQIDDLGKFGMGLKTASLSQCRKFSIVSRSAHEVSENELYGFQWDIDYIKKSKNWSMIELPIEKIKAEPGFKEILRTSGTVVSWEKLDKLDKKMENAHRPSIISGNIIAKLSLFIRMTFHRFLDGSMGKNKTIKIYFNDIPLDGWDPFCRKESNTLKINPKEFIIEELSTKEPILIEPFILPAKEGVNGFSSLKEWKDAKGLLSWNDSQGCYIYRANRLIMFGGWFETRAKDEHTKLARIAISFNPVHDRAFVISMDKTRSQLPSSLYGYFKTELYITEVIRKAKVQYNSPKNYSQNIEELKKEIEVKPGKSEIEEESENDFKGSELKKEIEVEPGKSEIEEESENDIENSELKKEIEVKPGKSETEEESENDIEGSELEKEIEVKIGNSEIEEGSENDLEGSELKKEIEVEPGKSEIEEESENDIENSELKKEIEVEPGKSEIEEGSENDFEGSELEKEIEVKPGKSETEEESENEIENSELKKEIEVKPGNSKTEEESENEIENSELKKEIEAKMDNLNTNITGLLSENGYKFKFQSEGFLDCNLWKAERQDDENYIIKINENHSIYKHLFCRNNDDLNLTSIFKKIIYSIVYTELICQKNNISFGTDQINLVMAKFLEDDFCN